MSEAVRNAMRGEAERSARQVAKTRMGLVDGVNPAKHLVRVRLQPEDVLTGWLPVETLSVGPGWRVHYLPPVGAQVKVEFQEGSNESGIVTGCVYDDAHPASEGVPEGAAWIDHGDARIQLNADGSIFILSGTVHIGGLEATMRRLLKEEAAAIYNGHTHPSNGAPPTQKITADHMTANLTAS